MSSKSQSEFHVVLHGIKLSDEIEQHIEKQIQEIVLAELANYTPSGDGNEDKVLSFYFPKVWCGLPAWLVPGRVFPGDFAGTITGIKDGGINV